MYELAGQPCFFTIRAYRKLRPFVNQDVASVAQRCLLKLHQVSGCEVCAYCIMPDHVHVVVMPLEDGPSSLTVVDRFKGHTSFELGRAGWVGKVWQKGYYEHLITHDESMDRVIDYILDNPVRAGICEDPEEYLWSGLPGMIR